MFTQVIIILGLCCITSWAWGIYCGFKVDTCPAWKASLVMGLIYTIGAILMGILIPFPEFAKDENTTVEDEIAISVEKTVQKDTVYVVIAKENRND